MAKPDRDVSFMRENFGTNSLITDYKPEKNKILCIDDVIKLLDFIIERPYNNSSEPYSEGYSHGQVDCAKLIKTHLEKLQ
jgi:hypothetical protein